MYREFSSRTLVSCERDQLLFYNMHVFTKNTAVYLHQINSVFTLRIKIISHERHLCTFSLYKHVCPEDLNCIQILSSNAGIKILNQTNIWLDAMTLPWLEQNFDYMKLEKTFNLSHVKEVAFDDVQICWKRLLIYLNRFCYINSTSHKLSVENMPSTIKNVNLHMKSLFCFNWKPRDVKLCLQQHVL